MKRADNRRLPPRERLIELLDYNPDTGALTWKYNPEASAARNSRWSGQPALNCSHTQGYRRGTLEGRHAFAHRVIFKIMTGLEPSQIDHDDGDRENNKWGNLYAATAVDNAHNVKAKSNNVSGRTGVHMGAHGKWIAQIRCHRIRKIRHLGSFSDFGEACRVREAAEREIGFRVRAATGTAARTV